MHQFSELTGRSLGFVLNKLDELESDALQMMETSSATIHIKNLQSINLQRAICAVGAFSIFEAHLQDQFSSNHGTAVQYAFDEASKKLKNQQHMDLCNKFEILIEAINVLKHGRGKSYEKLLKRPNLPFRFKKPNEYFFDEGDLSEVQTMIQVDSRLVIFCLQVIDEVSSKLGLK